MLRDHDFRLVLKVTAGYVVLALALIALQPGPMQKANVMAGGNIELPMAGVNGYLYQLALAQ